MARSDTDRDDHQQLSTGSGKRGRNIRQAIVIVHGMGDQRPLDALNGFISAALGRETTGQRLFYSRPDDVTGSYEERRYLAPRRPPEGDPEEHAQTEFYEYHWAYKMQGNRISDMWPTFRKMLLRAPNSVPSGLLVVWLIFWILVGTAVWASGWGPLQWLSPGGQLVAQVATAILGGGFAAVALTFLVARVFPAILPGIITKSFVDVVRYLDTSPRSYQVRFDIRKGMVDLLKGLHDARDGDEPRYQRIVVVAHSLGAYIAYDGISYLWAQMNTHKIGRTADQPEGLSEVERLASEIVAGSAVDVDAFQAAQRNLWLGIRAQGNQWRITDFVSCGTPMYFADVLYTKNKDEFATRVGRWELPTCPPQSEGGKTENNINCSPVWFSFIYRGDRSLYHGAPFAVTRWTNLWFPAVAHFFGDWFGGPLAPLFGGGIKDIKVGGNKPRRLIPGYAHALYFKFGQDSRKDSVTTHLRAALDLASTNWVPVTSPAVTPSPTEEGASSNSYH